MLGFLIIINDLNWDIKMSNEIHSGMLPIKEIFEKWFCIPNYQRSYVWEKDQVMDLLDDISSASKKNPESQYFLGSLGRVPNSEQVSFNGLKCLNLAKRRKIV